MLDEINRIDSNSLSGQQLCIQIQKILNEMVSTYPGMNTENKVEMQSIREDCQLLAYSSAYNDDRKEELKTRTLVLLRKIQEGHSAYL